MRRPQWLVCLVMLHGLSSAFAGDAPVPLPVTQVADGVFVHTGAQAEANRDNKGDIANIGFIVGTDCVAVVDTGGSPRIGEALRRAIATRTATPVCYVINTHMHPDHVLGNRTFVNEGTRFVAAAGFDQALAARGASYLDRLPDTIGMDADDSWLVMPDRHVEQKTTLDLGEREIVLEHGPTAHTDNDLTVFDRRTRTLWTGDLLFVDRIPSIDGSITGWLETMDDFAANRIVATVIPGHGPVSNDLAPAMAPQQRYLETVRDDVREAIAEGYSLQHTATHAAQTERDRWLLFDDYHPRNITAAYTELEWE